MNKNLINGKVYKRMREKQCFSIFFCGCNQLKSFHNGRKGNMNFGKSKKCTATSGKHP